MPVVLCGEQLALPRHDHSLCPVDTSADADASRKLARMDKVLNGSHRDAHAFCQLLFVQQWEGSRDSRGMGGQVGDGHVGSQILKLKTRIAIGLRTQILGNQGVCSHSARELGCGGVIVDSQSIHRRHVTIFFNDRLQMVIQQVSDQLKCAGGAFEIVCRDDVAKRVRPKWWAAPMQAKRDDANARRDCT